MYCFFDTLLLSCNSLCTTRKKGLHYLRPYPSTHFASVNILTNISMPTLQSLAWYFWRSQMFFILLPSTPLLIFHTHISLNLLYFLTPHLSSRWSLSSPQTLPTPASMAYTFDYFFCSCSPIPLDLSPLLLSWPPPPTHERGRGRERIKGYLNYLFNIISRIT